MNKEEIKLTVQEAVEAQEKELTPKEQKMLQKKQEKAEKERNNYLNGMIRRVEVFQLIDKYSRQAAESMGEMLREPIRTNLISTMAISDLLKEKGIITEEEHLNAMNNIAEQMNASLESLDEGEDYGQEGNEDGESSTEETQE